VFVASLMTTSRGSIASIITFFGISLVMATFLQRELKPFLARTLRTGAFAAALSLPLLATNGGQDYLGYFNATLGPKASILRLKTDETLSSSEGSRLKAIAIDLKLWAKAPLFGQGVLPFELYANEIEQPLLKKAPPRAMFSEVLAEHGLVGALLIAIIIYIFMRPIIQGRRLLCFPILFTHFVVIWLFSQNLPRFDYWLLLLGLAHQQRIKPQT
jgi:hypothetical protein